MTLRGLDEAPAWAVAVHRGVAAHGRPGIPWAAWWPLLAWRDLRWRAGGAARAVGTCLANVGDEVAAATGIQPFQLQERLLRLARHGVPVGDALALGLFLDERAGYWPLHVYDFEIGWNTAASTPGGAPALQALQDKRRSAQILAEIAVPTVPTIAAVTARSLADPAASVARWAEPGPIHVKDPLGSRGRGAFEVHQDPGGLRVRRYQQTTDEADPDGFIRAAFERDCLVQPLLVSAAEYAGVCDSRDVITVRVVTRRVGLLTDEHVTIEADGDPELFSTVLELPLAQAGYAPARYAQLVVDATATVTGPVRPVWAQVGARTEDHSANPAPAQANRIAAVLVGVQLPSVATAQALAVQAHRAFPGVFAVAWDVALTDSGPQFLEGNTGFGTRIPQICSGGLLAG